jgi:death-on-curing protein
MSETLYLTLEEGLALHAELIRRFGGSPGIRDPGLLESALARPRSGYYRTLSEQAAALMQSLASNHCFIDGNKRMAFAAAAIFLRINGFHLQVDGGPGESFLVGRVIVDKAGLAEITAWMEARIKPALP